MNGHESAVRARFAAFLDWEKTKRREEILIAAFFWSLVFSLPVVLLRPIRSAWLGLALAPAVFFLAAVGAGFLRRRWSQRESLKALFRLDRQLRLEDRALTAWDILERGTKSGAEALVVEETAERLSAFDPRVTFGRTFSWQARAVPVLLVVWLGAAWFYRGDGVNSELRGVPVVAAARALQEFLEPVQEKAELQGLGQSLELARSLREIAQRVMKNELDEETFRSELGSAMSQRLAVRPDELNRIEGALFPVSRSGLEDLGAEIAEFKRQLGTLPIPGGGKLSDPQIGERLAQLPRLEQALRNAAAEQAGPAGNELDAAALQSLLERLEAQLKSQMERLTQEEIQEFVASILGPGEGDPAQKLARGTPAGERESEGSGDKEDGLGSLPGNEPGEKRAGSPTPASATAGAASQVKGEVQEGARTRVRVQGENPIGASRATTERVPADYQRQVERELAREEIPEHLKDTIKKYFLSLGKNEGS